MLNEEQLAAVRHEGENLLVVAGPGTGKTATIARRISRLATGLKPGQKILAITFTNKASREMAARLGPLGVDLAHQATVGTFHSFSLHLLRQYEDRLSFPLTFSIASPEEIKALAREIWPDLSRRDLCDILARISRWKGEFLPASDDADINTFREKMRERALVDFDDILRDAVILLKEEPDIRAQVRAAYPYVFVDEYQDVSAGQVALLKELVGDGVSLTAIGDPNQAIYGFRGSDVGYFHAFEKMFAPVRKLTLSRNYRSAQDLVSAGGQLIEKGARFPVAPVIAQIRAKGLLKQYSAMTDKAEAEYVAHAIEKMVGGISSFSRASGRVGTEEGGRSFGDIVVLYRLNVQGRLIREALDRLGIPCQVSGDKALQMSRETVSALKAMPQDMAPLKALQDLRRSKPSLHEEWAELSAIAQEGSSLGSFLDQLALQIPEDRCMFRAEKVSLLTLHAAKGLEFPVVFIVGCEEGLIPLEMEGFSSDFEEERRLFYVGMTRAREELVLVHARRRLLYGKTLELSPSRFLADIDEALKAYEAQVIRESRRDPEKDQMKLF